MKKNKMRKKYPFPGEKQLFCLKQNYLKLLFEKLSIKYLIANKIKTIRIT